MNLDEHLEAIIVCLDLANEHLDDDPNIAVSIYHAEAARAIIAKGEIRWAVPEGTNVYLTYPFDEECKRVLVIPLEGERSDLDEEAPDV